MNEDYIKARRSGEKAYRRAVITGKYPYLPALDDFLKGSRRAEVPGGIKEISLDLVVGTRTRGRQEAFADNFMPLLAPESEFATKWSLLCNAQKDEGIRDPVKVYEYMWKFYVLEGNKRVSVLKYMDSPSVTADIMRILPEKSNDKAVRVYYEFDSFFRQTGMYGIIFSEEGCYKRLADIFSEELSTPWRDESITLLRSVFFAFSQAYKVKNPKLFTVPVSDAFLIYLIVFGTESLENGKQDEIIKKIDRIHTEFMAKGSENNIAFLEEPYNVQEGSSAGYFLKRQKVYTEKHPFKVSFIYDVEPKNSGWVYGHELGRNQLEEYYQGIVATETFTAKDNEEDFIGAVEQAVAGGSELIITTSPIQMDMALRAAVEFPKIKIMNCSVNISFNSVRTYYGKMHEAKFLMGVLAATVAKDHKIGYVSDYPICGAAARVNAFAIGAAMADPDISVYLTWTSLKDKSWQDFMRKKGITTISGPDIINPAKAERDYGLYSIEEDGSVRNLAMPVWDWGKYYELIVRNIMNGGWERESSEIKGRALNYFWGMSSGVIDVITSQSLSYNTCKMLDFYKKGIINDVIHPFDGELRSHKGLVKESGSGSLSNEEIVKMDWFNENIIGRFPDLSELNESGKRVVRYSGIPGIYGQD